VASGVVLDTNLSSVASGVVVDTYQNYSPSTSANQAVNGQLTSSTSSITVLPALTAPNFYYLKSCDFQYAAPSGSTSYIELYLGAILLTQSVVTAGPGGWYYYTQQLDNFQTTGPVVLSVPFALPAGDLIKAILRYSVGP
jgi:hypothetical protein